MDTLTEDDLETIEIIARNGQSGRITEREVKLLVAVYRERLAHDAERKAHWDHANGCIVNT